MDTTTSPAPRPRRAETRRPARVRTWVFSPLFGTPVECDSTDLSTGGMHLDTHLLLRPGEKVLLEFSPPGSSRRILVDASVAHARWFNRNGVGFRFERIASDERRVLRDALAGDA